MKLSPSDIVLILPPRRWKERRYSLGLLFISGYLRNSGYDNIILERKLLVGREYDNSLARELLLKKIEELKPKIIAFTGTILETNEIIELNNKIKEKIEVFSVIGGPQASVCPEEFVKNNFNAAVIGEGEETIMELVKAIESNDSDLGKIKGIAYKDKEGNIRVNPPRELMDISFLPLPAYDKIDMAYHTAITNEVVRGIPVKPAMVMSSRGCPFLCSFCSTYKVFGRKVRYRDPESVKKEIEFLKDNYGVESIWFSDDTMTINKDHLLKICQIMRKLDLFWTAQARVDLVDEDVVKEMKESGCLQLEFGIESGCPRLLNEIIIKQINLEQVKKAVALCRKYKIRVLANFMMGFPTETKKEMEATFNLAKSLKANIYSFSILTPLPGTDIFNRFFKDDIIMDDYKDLSFFIGKKKFNKSEVDDLKKLNDLWRKKLWLQVRIRNLTHPFLFIKIFFKFGHKKERIKFVFNKIKKLIKFNKRESMGSEKRFGYEWGRYHQMDSNYEIQFKKWISPFNQEIFKDKKVLDAGCGMGRNSYWPLKYGAKEVAAFDFDQRSAAAARKNLSPYPNAKIEFRSIYDLPWENEFDIVFCIGVIHHLENPQLAIKNLIKAARPGGLILIWVYGYESNEGIVKWINPLRIHLTSKLPLPILHLFTYCFSLPLWIFLKLFPQKSPYLKQVSQFKFFHLHSIIFDQLLPKIANYYKKDEACRLLAEQGLKNIGISHPNENSWTIYGYKSENN